VKDGDGKLYLLVQGTKSTQNATVSLNYSGLGGDGNHEYELIICIPNGINLPQTSDFAAIALLDWVLNAIEYLWVIGEEPDPANPTPNAQRAKRVKISIQTR
jgi:hypothetical protein